MIGEILLYLKTVYGTYVIKTLFERQKIMFGIKLWNNGEFLLNLVVTLFLFFFIRFLFFIIRFFSVFHFDQGCGMM